MSQALPQYNNNLVSPKGRLNRLFYILHNAFWNILGFRFVYYPVILESLQSSSEFSFLIKQLASNPKTAEFVPYLKAKPDQAIMFIALRYVFIVILRLVDIKRVRDLVNRELSIIEQGVIAVILSIPYIDFLSTCILSVVPSNKFAKSQVEAEVKKADLLSAKKEEYLELNKRLFASGKISRAEFERAREKYKNN